MSSPGPPKARAPRVRVAWSTLEGRSPALPCARPAPAAQLWLQLPLRLLLVLPPDAAGGALGCGAQGPGPP